MTMPFATLAVDLLIAVINNASQISQLLSTAKAANRDISMEELQSIVDSDALARAHLVITIAAAKAAGK